MVGSSSSRTSGRFSSCAARPRETTWPPLRVRRRRVEGDVGEAEPIQLGPGALLDVPVVADRGEVLLARVPGLDGAQRPDHRSDPQYLGHGQVAGQRQALREVAEHPSDGHGPAAGPVLAGDQLEQGALTGTVRCDEARAAAAHGEGQVLEDRGVVGPGEGQVRADDERIGHARALVCDAGAPGAAQRGTGDRGTTARPRRRRSCAPTDGRSLRYHPEMSSSLTTSGLPCSRSLAKPTLAAGIVRPRCERKPEPWLSSNGIAVGADRRPASPSGQPTRGGHLP